MTDAYAGPQHERFEIWVKRAGGVQARLNTCGSEIGAHLEAEKMAAIPGVERAWVVDRLAPPAAKSRP